MFEGQPNQSSALAGLFAGLQPHPVRPPLILNLPNLRANQISFVHAANSVEVKVNIANTGRRDSGPFWVMGIITRNGQVQPRQAFNRRPNLSAQMVEDVSLVTITDLSDTSAEVICVTVLVDPPTPQQAWGEVIETNVEDNNLQDCIIIPPPKPEMPPEDPGDIGDEDRPPPSPPV